MMEKTSDVTTTVCDADGNQTRVQTSTGIWAVSYDTENRPTDFTCTAADNTITTVHCEYDHMGRRAIKKVTVNGNVTLHQRYIYRGYLQIACIDLTRSNHPGLWLITWDPTQNIATRPLAIQKDATWYTYGWDLTKNICEVFGPAGYLRTAYTYTPYGQVTANGDVEQPIQWSSEYCDTELGLVYYNYRHYNPVDGRWIGRDDVEVLGNVYSFTSNFPVIYTDYIGYARYKTDKQNCTLTIRFVWAITFGRGWKKDEKKEWKQQAKKIFDDYFNTKRYKCVLEKCSRKEECNEYKVIFALRYVSDANEADFLVRVTNDKVLSPIRPYTAPKESFRRRRVAALNRSSIETQTRNYKGRTATTNDFLHEIGHMMDLEHPGKEKGRSSTGALEEYEADRESLMGLGLKFRMHDFQKACCSKIYSKNKFKAKEI